MSTVRGKRAKKPFLTDAEIEEVLEKFHRAWDFLYTPKAPVPRGGGRIIDLAVWKRQHGGA